jgi:hypothetical protein
MSDFLICEFCQKKFSTKGNCKAHKSTCKVKQIKEQGVQENLKESIMEKEIINQKELVIETMKKEIESKNKQIELLKTIILEFINKSSETINNNISGKMSQIK